MKDIRIFFRKNSLENLPPNEKRYYAIDTKIPELFLAVYPSGIKTFFFVKHIRRRKRRIKIGRFEHVSIEQAREKAKQYNAAIALRGDPYADLKEEKNEPTFRQLFEYYYTEHALKYNKRPLEGKALVDFHIMPVIANWKASEITTDKVRELHTMIGNTRGRTVANRVISRISTIYKFNIDNKKIKCANPAHGIKHYQEYPRERFLNRMELKAFFDAVFLEEELIQDYFLLLLYTGARKTNVLSMEYAAIDISLMRWRLPGFDSKNDDTNVVMLSEAAIEIITRRKEANMRLIEPSPYVFPSTGKTGHLSDPSRAWQRIRDKMGVQDINMHDLRRTLGSYMAIQGKSLQIIGKALNHKDPESTAIYARLSQNPILEAVNEAVEFIVSGDLPTFASNVASLFKKKQGTIKFRSLAA